jgi:hypothetical protein
MSGGTGSRINGVVVQSLIVHFHFGHRILKTWAIFLPNIRGNPLDASFSQLERPEG